MNLYLLRTYMDLQLLLFDIPPICDAVLRFRKIRKIKHPTTKDKDKDYPAMVSRCCEKDYIYQYGKPFESFFSRTIQVTGKKNPPQKYFRMQYRNVDLINAMNNLGGVGGKNAFCKNIVGRCAEQMAAELLLRKNPRCQLNQILFSTPIRPRTNEPRAYCENCIKLFRL